VRFGLRASQDKGDLIRVSDEDLFFLAEVALAVPAPGSAPGGEGLEAAQGALAGQDLDDGKAAFGAGFPADAVTYGDDGAIFGFVFEFAAHARSDGAAVVGAQRIEAALCFDDLCFVVG
jgi:hypothetical protein